MISDPTHTDSTAAAGAHQGTDVLTADCIAKTYQSAKGEVEAIHDVSLGVSQGSFVAVVGPSGCGKTTLLKCVAGLLGPTRGTVYLRGVEVKEPPRGLALVFQDYSRSLYPWLTVRKNVSLPLKGMDKAARDELVRSSIEAVGLSKFADHHPWQLSGGMQQRVAIARALAYQPEVLLMDEPFASVDAQTRAELEDLVLRVQAEYGVTILLVTHDIDEAVYMADEVIVLSRPPTTVVERVEVGIERPRNQISTKENPEFVHLRAHVYRAILTKEGAEED
ncbi:MAG: ABC transporter ATP-binding protein [Solirubrobacterales bacterium]